MSFFLGVHIVILLIKDTNQQTMVAFFNCYVVDFHKKSCTLTSIVCYHSKPKNNIQQCLNIGKWKQPPIQFTRLKTKQMKQKVRIQTRMLVLHQNTPLSSLCHLSFFRLVLISGDRKNLLIFPFCLFLICSPPKKNHGTYKTKPLETEKNIYKLSIFDNFWVSC